MNIAQYAEYTAPYSHRYSRGFGMHSVLDGCPSNRMIWDEAGAGSSAVNNRTYSSL